MNEENGINADSAGRHEPAGGKKKKYRRGDTIELDVESLSFGGAGVGRTAEGIVAFVPGAVPGDRVSACVTKRKKQFLEARVLEVLSPSPDRIEPRCEHFGLCGGCKWQNYPYELQLRAKKRQVADHLERIAGLPDPPVAEIIGMDDPWRYRNKMEYTFSRFKDETLKLGLHRPGFFDQVINIDSCHLQDERCNALRNGVLEFCRQRGLEPHNVRKHEGLLKNLVIRSAGSGIMACMVTHTDEFEIFTPELVSYISENHPEVKSLLWYINPLVSGVAIAGEERPLAGDTFITETILGLKLKISAASFLQTNTAQCEKLYSAIEKYMDSDGGGTVYDLYTGMAPIAMLLSRRAGKVFGIESVPQAVADGRVNLRENGIENVELIEGEVENVLPGLCESAPPDLVVADPPRVGIHKKALAAIVAAKPRRIVYVSCNPSTLARDAAILAEGGYRLSEITPVDMFPHTGHIECVARFDV